MAELLVFTTDTIGDDVNLNAKLPKRGDVITVQEDGWPWADGELSDPRFLVLKLPGVAVSELTSLTSPELAQGGSNDPSAVEWSMPTNTLQYRGFCLDLDSMQTDFPTIPAAHPAKGHISSAPVDVPDVDTLLSYKLQRPPITDPSIIGPSDNVIG